MFHNCGCCWLGETFGDDFIEKLSTFTKLHKNDVKIRLFINLQYFVNVGVIQTHHDCDFFKEALLKIFSKFVFVNLFGSSEHTSVKSLYFIDISIRALPNLVDDLVIEKEVFLFDFDEWVPLYFNWFEFFMKLI